MGGHGRRRGRRRTDQRRVVARTLLVGRHFHGEYSGRGLGHHRRRRVRSDIARPSGAARRRPRLDPVGGRNHGVGRHRHRSAHMGVDQRPNRDWIYLGRNRSRRVRAVGATEHPSDAGCDRVRQPSLFGRQPGRDRWLSDLVRIHLRHHPVLPIHQGLQRVWCRRAPAAGSRLDRGGQRPGPATGRTNRHHRRRHRLGWRSSRPAWHGHPRSTR